MNSKDTTVTVLGDGGWGTALSLLLASKGTEVVLWGAFPDYVAQMRKTRQNKKFLPGFKIPPKVAFSDSLPEALEASRLIVLAVPSQYMRSVVKKIRLENYKSKSFVSVAKGIEVSSLNVMSEVIHQELGQTRLGVVSGPCIAREVAQKMPAAASAASRDVEFARQIRELFTTEYFSLFESHDVLGVELGGSLKNVIAISAGIVEGLGFGSNTRAALFARGVAEMARLGEAMGANRQTFMGLSGLGDLATTCLSRFSRNRWLGEEIGKGGRLKTILSKTEMVIEGVDTARSAYELSKKYGVSMPITEAVYKILFKNRNPKETINALMHKGFHHELD